MKYYLLATYGKMCKIKKWFWLLLYVSSFFFFNSKPREQSEDFEKANKKRSTPNIILITKVASFFFSRPAVPGISVPCCFFDHQKITIEDTDKTK